MTIDGESMALFYKAIGVCLLNIVTGLVVYQTPPESWAQFGQWIWQPLMQGIMMSLTVVYGINKIPVKPTPK